MRTTWTVILACAALASLASSGCGGKSFGGGDLGDAGDDGGSSSSSGGSSGGSSSSSGSGSGGSSSSSGGSSSSSGGGVCPPQPGEGSCSYGEQCNYGSGCGETSCSCSLSGQWECAVSDCPPPACPAQWPQDLPCDAPGMTCDYASGGGGGGTCGSSCTCVPYGADGGAYAWSCVSPPCPPPSCPPAPPQNGDACSAPSEECDYTFDSGCGGVYCTCDPSGTWSCAIGDCVDAGGIPDAGWGGD